MRKMRFKDLPRGACFKLRTRSNTGRKVSFEYVRWHGDRAANYVLSTSKDRKKLTRTRFVIVTECPEEWPPRRKKRHG